MGSLEGVKVGDKLLLLTRYGGLREKEPVPQEVTAVKVGRTLLYIPVNEGDPSGKTLAYRIEDGRWNGNYGHTYLWKREDWEVEKRRTFVQDRLRHHGVQMRDVKPTEVLEALVKVLDDAEAEGK
jgi:hypothetical protein